MPIDNSSTMENKHELGILNKVITSYCVLDSFHADRYICTRNALSTCFGGYLQHMALCYLKEHRLLFQSEGKKKTKKMEMKHGKKRH